MVSKWRASSHPVSVSPCSRSPHCILATIKGKNDSGSDNDVNDNHDDDHIVTEPDSEDEAGDVQPRAPTRGTRGKRGRGGARATGTRRKKATAAGEDVEDGAKLAKDAKISADNPLFSQLLRYRPLLC
jgi:hypothetical protein